MDIATLKQQVSIADVLEHYGVWDLRVRDGWQSVKCPFHDDNVFSGSANLFEDRYYCHACGVQGDILDIVKSAELFSSIKEAKDWIEENLT